MKLQFLHLIVVLTLIVMPVQAADREEEKPTGLPIPRFASLRSEEVNMRAGPGTRYPIAWVYNRKGLPVEIVAEFDIWRRVRDPEGTEGWVHKTEITGKRMAIVTGGQHDLHETAEDASPVTAHLEAGVIGQISSCQRDWCKLKFEGAKGYLRKTQFWGAYPAEVFE